ncbi:cysteine protease StiP family protein [Spartinivicinus poritis]|uniref:Cysteine protease StiP family protein n=1 Tax=Spartinivicinus poritis TaxID=2994640 RepID=A0ABT5U5H1_9GAMM|nr:cysteine protease StiP family protein [Spartinivicinus sp. A2-2]MDE1461606.1 cysteine protease StiP family protein [Spartinivicinus sp. A2-2]
MGQQQLLTGSYHPEDCQFLLQEAEGVELLTVEEKEQRLQSGIHYSQMVSIEQAPTQAYLEIFYKLTAKYKNRLATEIIQLAKLLQQTVGRSITLVSLARAGTPIGILLKRALLALGSVSSVQHYSISIIRGKGIDEAALAYLQASGVKAESIVFVDGWTAKGAITRELKQAIADWNINNKDYQLSDKLCVVSDIGFTAHYVATYDDYVIPSGILNSTVSGLVSRTIRNPDVMGFHQCVTYHDLQNHDLSNWFIEEVASEITQLNTAVLKTPEILDPQLQQRQHQVVLAYLTQVMKSHDITDINKVKPGIAEATRVMLRRIPDLLILKNRHQEDVEHLLMLAEEKQISVAFDPTMPFNALALIKDLTRNQL